MKICLCLLIIALAVIPLTSWAGPFVFGIYDSGTRALVDQTAASSTDSNNPRWYTLDVTGNAAVSASGVYDIAMSTDSPWPEAQIHYDTVASTGRRGSVTYTGSMPDPVTWNITTAESRRLSIYATYTAAGTTTETVIDDGDADWSKIGTWTQNLTEGLNSDMHYDETGTGSESATWNFGALEGSCEVEVHYSIHTNRATDAPFTVKNHTAVEFLPTVSNPIVSITDNVDETGSADADATTIDINQERDNTGNTGVNNAPSGYVGIGTYTFGGVEDALVILTDDANEYVIADAVRTTCTLPDESKRRIIITQ